MQTTYSVSFDQIENAEDTETRPAQGKETPECNLRQTPGHNRRHRKETIDFLD